MSHVGDSIGLQQVMNHFGWSVTMRLLSCYQEMMERPPRIARYATLVSATMTAVKVMGRTTWSARYETVKLFSSTVLGNKKKTNSNECHSDKSIADSVKWNFSVINESHQPR